MSKDPEESVAAKKRSGRRRPHRERPQGPMSTLQELGTKPVKPRYVRGWETGVNREGLSLELSLGLEVSRRA